MDAATTALLIGLSLALLLASAKLHGRQLRLEREWEGQMHVEFGGYNHPWVEALWRRDRIRFWTLAPLVALAMVGHAFLSPLPHPVTLKGAGALYAIAWAPSAAFVALALVSLARLRRATAGASDRVEWRAAASRGSLVWLAATGAFSLAVLALAW